LAGTLRLIDVAPREDILTLCDRLIAEFLH
jgi:hypothetical protein